MKKVLLDENLPEQLKPLFSPELEIYTVNEMGWSALVNGELLSAMVSEHFDLLLTVDKNLPFQQNLAKYPLQVVVVRCVDNRFKTLSLHMREIEIGIWSIPDDEKVVVIDLRNKP